MKRRAVFASTAFIAAGALVLSGGPLGLMLPMWIVAGLAIYFGIDAGGPISAAEAAAQALLGGVR